MTDGWEYYSAKDLNIKAVPYPGKRPFPNALDPSDGAPAGNRFSQIDFDGDGLTTLEEYRAWRITGSNLTPSRQSVGLESALGYSDGTKYSRASDTPSAPAWRSSSFGASNPTQPFPATYDLQGDAGSYQDDERDADARRALELPRVRPRAQHSDVVGGLLEGRGTLHRALEQGRILRQRPGDYDERPFAELDLADPDVDGDTLLDGEDDQDADDYNNITELYETEYDLDGNGAVYPGPGGRVLRVNPMWCGKEEGWIPTIDVDGVDRAINPFNPCAPVDWSRSCPTRIPMG